MKDDYLPNEKYRNMFGVERNGYGCERVDLYLAQLEVAFKKIREDNRNLKRELTEQSPAYTGAASPREGELIAQLEQQGQYIMQLQAQLAEQQEYSRQMTGTLDINADNPNDALLVQIEALRGEADALRQQLRRQATGAPAVNEEEQQNMIGKVLVEARSQAEETLRNARQESDAMMRKARQKVEELRSEQERVQSQLQAISYGLRNVLRGTAGAEYQQRGEDFAAS